MAVMYPKTLTPYDPTESERVFYNSLKEQLSDKFKVFYSVKWYSLKNGHKINSEADFIIFNRDYGYLTIEVKGGKGIIVKNSKWQLLYSNGQYRVLSRSPFDQAEESMRYFYDYFRKEYYKNYVGIYGYAAAFPFYNLDDDVSPRIVNDICINYSDMNNLESKIYEIFMYWRSMRTNYQIAPDIAEKYIKLIEKKVSISEAKGAVLDKKKKELEKLNIVQNNLLEFISNYKQVYIKGGAGTGKTWLGIKKIDKKLSEDPNSSILFICKSEILAKFVEEKIPLHVDVYPIKLSESINKKYELIVVDEAQDLSEEEAIEIKLLLKNEIESELYILYDPEQNISQKMIDYFYIDTTPFILKANIRNTKNIYQYAVNESKKGKMSYSNTIEGISPQVDHIKNKRNAISRIENIVRDLVYNEEIDLSKIIIISDFSFEKSLFMKYGVNEICNFEIEKEYDKYSNEKLKFTTIKNYKGLESDIVIFINHREDITDSEKYVAYTRARYILYVIKLY